MFFIDDYCESLCFSMQAAVELFLESTLKSVTLYFSFLFFCGCTRSGLAQNCQNSFLDQGNRCIREPSHLFESIVIVGLPPQADIHELENIALGSNEEDVKKPRNIFGNNHHQVHALSNLEPQVIAHLIRFVSSFMHLKLLLITFACLLLRFFLHTLQRGLYHSSTRISSRSVFLEVYRSVTFGLHTANSVYLLVFAAGCNHSWYSLFLLNENTYALIA